MNNLYLLLLLLIGNRRQAELCFVAVIEDCARENHVFKEWALSWARRAVVQNAIRLIPSLRKPADSGRIRHLEHDPAAFPGTRTFLLQSFNLMCSTVLYSLCPNSKDIPITTAQFSWAVHEVIARQTHALLRLTETNEPCVRSREIVQASTEWSY